MRHFNLPRIALISLLCSGARGATLEIEVSAGPHPRRDTPVSLEAPQVAARAVLKEIVKGEEKIVPVQVEPPATGAPCRVHWVLAGETPAGAVRRFRLELAQGAESADAGGGVLRVLDEKGRHLQIERGGKPVLRYNYGKVPPPEAGIPPIQTRNAYLHPLWSPAGLLLTMDYPRNHLHHRGVWFPWVHTEFEGRHPDFWNLGDGTGTVEFEAMDTVLSGPVFAGFRARHRHMDLSAKPEPKAALLERWDVRVYAAGKDFLFDLDSYQECAGTSPLRLDEYRYGGLGVRGSWDWEGEALRVFTSEGKGRLNGEGSRARWLSLCGPVGGNWGGITILGHPANFRAPQPVRVHPSEPFVNFAPVKAGELEITPGKPYISRYRFHLHDGVTRADEEERLWLDYAEPPSVNILP